ncbi:hypothetical protein BKA65DRAFT_487322 [Rhexocercosporidium sp. MPI-PUGE-AT-0058]|nr:hypothetical protein BKA65DRAFT_487322 [Rhexocercosporidium sp. MPI-PUGE-AT-0058]
MEVVMEGSTDQQPLGLGISDYGEQRQSSTVRSDTLVPNQSPEKAPSSTSSVKATTPIAQVGSEEKAKINTSSVAAAITPTQVDSQRKTRSHTPSIKSATSTSQVDSLKITANEYLSSMDVGSTMSPRNLRKRKEPPTLMFDPVTEAMRPLTDEERQNWKGWVELESDPALFNFILRKWGIQDVKVQEVFGLDEECMSFVPKPIYGMIFLFRYHDDDAEALEDAEKCPKHVWFANQTTNNACATIALFNIVMNIPGLDLGENLQNFKEATQKLKPAYRGKRLGDNQFIRGIHNSFARKIDILNADLCLKHEYEKWVKTNKNPPKKAPAKKSKAEKKQDDDEPGYHFIAYVPIRGEVWRLDGLQREPVKLGDCGDDWIDVASANIMQRALQYQDDGVEYSLMSLCKSPTRAGMEEMAVNMRLVQALEKTLDETIPDWKVYIESRTAATIEDLLKTCKLTQDLVDRATPSEFDQAKLDTAGGDPAKIMDLYTDLVKEQDHLRSAYMQEVGMIGQEDEQALKRKVDHTPIIYKAMQALAGAGVLRDIVNDVREQAANDEN